MTTYTETELPFGASDDDWWRSCATAAIETEARTGRTFQAYDLVEIYGLAEPSSSAQWGSLFRALHVAGVIKPVGYAQSKRPTVAGSACRVWIGAR